MKIISANSSRQVTDGWWGFYVTDNKMDSMLSLNSEQAAFIILPTSHNVRAQ